MPVSVFVIALDGKIRSPNLLGDLNALGLSPLVISAVDGRKGNDAQLLSRVDRAVIRDTILRDLTSTEIAATASHAEIYQQMVSQRIKVAMVFEDDATISELTTNYLDSLMGILTSGTPRIVSLYAAGRIVLKKKPVVSNNIFNLYRFFIPPTYAVGYLINLEAAEIAHAGSKSITGVADWPIWGFLVDFYLPVPWPVGVLEETNSTIAEQRDLLTQVNRESTSQRILRLILVAISTVNFGAIDRISAHLVTRRKFFSRYLVPRILRVVRVLTQRSKVDSKSKIRLFFR
jgi:GR25 family glycosyltransferase involved in LPS biosynthesis